MKNFLINDKTVRTYVRIPLADEYGFAPPVAVA
jgi:hypothetical protein